MAFGAGGGGSSQISTSADVALSSINNKDVLSYDQSVGKWKNTAPGGTYTAVIFYNAASNSWPLRSTVGDPLTVEWRGPDNSKPPIDNQYARNGYDTFYAIS